MTSNSGVTISEKTARLEAARAKLQEFVAGGGSLKSPEATPLGIEFLHAYDDLAREVGYKILRPIKQADGEAEAASKLKNANTNRYKTLEAFLKLFTFDKKRDLEKYCREVVHPRERFCFLYHRM